MVTALAPRVVLPSYVFEALNVTVFGLTTNDLALPAKKVTPGYPLKDRVGVSVRLYVFALRVEVNVRLIAIVPVIPAIFTLTELASAVNVCAVVNVGNKTGINEDPKDVALVEYQ